MTLTTEERRDKLQKEIDRYVSRGFIVSSQTDTTAQLIKKKKFSLFWALFWLILGIGVGLVIYIFVYMARKDETVYLSVDTSGKVSRR